VSGVWKITVRALTGPSANKFTRFCGYNYGRFIIDYAHVMHLVTVIV